MNDSLPTAASAKPSHGLPPIAMLAGMVAVGLGLTALLVILLARQHEPQATTGSSDPSSVQIDVESPITEKRARGEPLPLAAEMKDYSASNAVSILLGQESDEDGIRHLAEEPDGRTSIVTLDDVPCRLHNRKVDNKGNGFLYFAIHPDFKRDELKTARIEFEYRVAAPTYVRLQYDGMQGDMHKPYKSAAPSGAEMVSGANRFIPIRADAQWQTIAFDATDGVFMNSENGGADFRLEVTPPQIYVRRVTVARPDLQSPRSGTNR